MDLPPGRDHLGGPGVAPGQGLMPAGGVTGVAGQGEIPDLVEVTVLPLPPSAAASTTGSSWNTSTKPGNFTSASFGSDVPASGSSKSWASSPGAGSRSPTRGGPRHRLLAALMASAAANGMALRAELAMTGVGRGLRGAGPGRDKR